MTASNRENGSADDGDFRQTPSKPQRKRDMFAMQEIGRQLTMLGPEQLAQMPLSDTLASAIADYKKINSREASRRQLQYIGKLMRAADLSEIDNHLQRFTASSLHHVNLHHLAEQWRTALLTEGKPALTNFVSQFPDSPVQQLRQLIQRATQELESGKKTGAGKKLYRQLVLIIEPTPQ